MIEDFASFGHLGKDLALRVHDRSVITAEGLADLIWVIAMLPEFQLIL